MLQPNPPFGPLWFFIRMRNANRGIPFVDCSRLSMSDIIQQIEVIFQTTYNRHLRGSVEYVKCRINSFSKSPFVEDEFGRFNTVIYNPVLLIKTNKTAP